MGTAVQAPRFRRFSLRLALFLLVLTGGFLYTCYSVFNLTVRGAIRHGDGFEIVDLKAMGFFPIDQNNGTINEVPRRWRDLDGKRVQLEGFMYAGQSAGPDLTDFQFVYNIAKCCFNGPPLVQERVFAHVPGNHAIPYYSGFVRLTGTLHARGRHANGNIVAIYTLDVDQAEPIT